MKTDNNKERRWLEPYTLSFASIGILLITIGLKANIEIAFNLALPLLLLAAVGKVHERGGSVSPPPEGQVDSNGE